MTLKNLRNAMDLCQEMETDGGSPLLFVYTRRTGQTLFAVFPSIDLVDLGLAPEVATFAQIQRPADGWGAEM